MTSHMRVAAREQKKNLEMYYNAQLYSTTQHCYNLLVDSSSEESFISSRFLDRAC